MSTVSEQTELWGINARDHGAEAAAQASSEWTFKADTWVRYWALNEAGREFTIEDIYEACGRPDSPNAAGALLLNASKAGLIQFVGYQRSSRIQRHAARIAVWRGAA